MIAPLSCTVLALFALASAQFNSNSSTSSTRQSSPSPGTIKESSSSSIAPTKTPGTPATPSTFTKTTSCYQITCYPPPTCSGARQARRSGTGVDNNGCPACYSYTCECLLKPCPPPRMCPNGRQQSSGTPTLDADGCPNCPSWVPCEDDSGPCCPPPPTPAPTCGDFTYLANITTAPRRDGCESCVTLGCERCQWPPCAMPPPCPVGMTQVSKGVFFPNGCPSCPQWDCIKTPECPPINTVNCGACPSGTKAVKVESVCPSCDKCVPIGSEEATASGTLVETVSEKTGVSVTTSGDPFETEESSGSHATMASIVAIFAFVSAAN